MNRLIFQATAFLAGLLWLFQGLFPPFPVAAQNVTALPLPDLQTLPPFDLQLIHGPNGARLLRFSNSVANTGAGPLDLSGEMDPETQAVTLIQQVHGEDAQLTQHLGGFAYHPEHGHWHWEGFSVYEIWSLAPDAELHKPVRHSGKVGYCMLDSKPADPGWLASVALDGLIPPEAQAYSTCGWRRQGISVGWVDTYERHLPGQSMDVSTLADGVYALRSTVDPDGLLLEADKSNNAALVYFHLQGTRLTVLDDVRFVRARIFGSLYGEALPEDLFYNPGGGSHQPRQ